MSAQRSLSSSVSSTGSPERMTSAGPPLQAERLVARVGRAHELVLGGIGVAVGDQRRVAVLVDHAHGAEVGQARHDRAHQGVEALGEADRRVEREADVGQQPRAVLGALGRLAGALLGVVQPGALERRGALRRERERVVPLLGAEPALVLREAERDRARQRSVQPTAAGPRRRCSGRRGAPGSSPASRSAVSNQKGSPGPQHLHQRQGRVERHALPGDEHVGRVAGCRQHRARRRPHAASGRRRSRRARPCPPRRSGGRRSSSSRVAAERGGHPLEPLRAAARRRLGGVEARALERLGALVHERLRQLALRRAGTSRSSDEGDDHHAQVARRGRRAAAGRRARARPRTGPRRPGTPAARSRGRRSQIGLALRPGTA